MTKATRNARLKRYLGAAGVVLLAMLGARDAQAQSDTAAPPRAAAETRARAATSITAIDAYLAQAVERTQIPGLVAMVADADGVLYAGAFGKQNVTAEVPMSLDTIFRIASMTKPVTSVGVVMLIEDGEIALDDPVSKYLPELARKQVIERFNPEDKSFSSRPARREITVRHLLTHTSGLGYGFSNEILFQLTGGDPGADTLDFPLLHDPGERWTYGESTRVLGRLIETVSGRGLEEFLRERIFVPLGMNDTSYRVPPAKHDRVVTVHAATEQGLAETPNPVEIGAPIYGDGGLHSTAADYVKFMQLFLNGGRAPRGTRLLSEASVALMGQNHTGSVRVQRQPAAIPTVSRPFPLGAGRDTYGLGFQVTGAHDEPAARSPGSMSWAGIFNTEFWIDPAEGICAVLLMQYLPFYDDDAIETLQGFERRVYQSLTPQ
jgi:CubicO group peptidase (beta-lactamase class C family)